MNWTPININRLSPSSGDMSNHPAAGPLGGRSQGSPGQGSPTYPPPSPLTPPGNLRGGSGGSVTSPDMLRKIIGALGTEHLADRPRPSWAYDDDEAKTSNMPLKNVAHLPPQLEPRPDLRVYTCRACITRFGEKSTNQLNPGQACGMDGPRDRCNNCKNSPSKPKCELVSWQSSCPSGL